ncbi:hypothetical protein [uncultured Virgibacillus sp.]|nr:hypothetical protein [uncultured Virgibacillus sp.]
MLSSFGIIGSIITFSVLAGLIYLFRRLIKRDNSSMIDQKE